MNTSSQLRDRALAYHQRMPDRIYQYLDNRGIPESIVHHYRLGWDGKQITIPITNKDREIVFFKLLKDPQGQDDTPPVISSSALQAELYGWERVLHKRPEVVVCENELDRLVFEAHGVAAVCSTSGAATFLPPWAKYFEDIPSVLVCFNCDAVGRGSAARIAELIPHSRSINLAPNAESEGTCLSSL